MDDSDAEVAAARDGDGRARRAGHRVRAAGPRPGLVQRRPGQGAGRQDRDPQHRPRPDRHPGRQRGRRHPAVLDPGDARAVSPAVPAGLGVLLDRPGRLGGGAVHRRAVGHPRQRVLLPVPGHRRLGPQDPAAPAAGALRRLPGRDGARARVGARDPEADHAAQRPHDRRRDPGRLLRRGVHRLGAAGQRAALPDQPARPRPGAVRLPAVQRPARLAKPRTARRTAAGSTGSPRSRTATSRACRSARSSTTTGPSPRPAS